MATPPWLWQWLRLLLVAVALTGGVVDGIACYMRGTMVWGNNAFTNVQTGELFVYAKVWPAYDPCACDDAPVDSFSYHVNVWYWTPTLTAPYSFSTCTCLVWFWYCLGVVGVGGGGGKEPVGT